MPHALVSTILNFAYGSNMLSARLRERVPSARSLGIAMLHGHELRWHKVARDGSGKCDIVAAAESDQRVYGIVYEIPIAEKPWLDRAEGLGLGYEEQTKTVEMAGRLIHVLAYVATHTQATLAPYSWYRALVVAGAEEHGLPASYVDGLRAVQSIEDPDPERHAKHWALAGHV